MNTTTKTAVFCVGAAIGAMIAISLALGGGWQHGLGRFAEIIEAPLGWTYYGLFGHDAPIGYFFLLHLCFWCVLVGLMFLGVAAFFSWLCRHE
jgi:hypothetical protein